MYKIWYNIYKRKPDKLIIGQLERREFDSMLAHKDFQKPKITDGFDIVARDVDEALILESESLAQGRIAFMGDIHPGV